MAKTRPNKKPPATHVKNQGSKGPVHTQMPRPQGGKPRNTGALTAAKSSQMNASMKKPGSGTRGSGKGAH
jgi:hypothetical protein